jgi:hypothetical protein
LPVHLVVEELQHKHLAAREYLVKVMMGVMERVLAKGVLILVLVAVEVLDRWAVTPPPLQLQILPATAEMVAKMTMQVYVVNGMLPVVVEQAITVEARAVGLVVVVVAEEAYCTDSPELVLVVVVQILKVHSLKRVVLEELEL